MPGRCEEGSPYSNNTPEGHLEHVRRGRDSGRQQASVQLLKQALNKEALSANESKSQVPEIDFICDSGPQTYDQSRSIQATYDRSAEGQDKERIDYGSRRVKDRTLLGSPLAANERNGPSTGIAAAVAALHERRPRRKSSLQVEVSVHDSGDNETVRRRPLGSSSTKSRFRLCGPCRERMLDGSPISTDGSPSASPAAQAARSRRRRSSHREALVGSYEESLLSQRLAAISCSPPMAFDARIGVLSRDGRCPAHVTLPFEAVFYDWSGDRARGSPYVANLDVDGHYMRLRAAKRAANGPRSRDTTPEPRHPSNPKLATPIHKHHEHAPHDTSTLKPQDKRKFPGYRIPRQGQLQIVLFNAEKTAVQLLLVPYDLQSMPPGSKTFVRLKMYDRETKHLINAVHMQVACPGKTKLYLYGSARIVFQNRTAEATRAATAGPAASATHSLVEYGDFSRWQPPARCANCSVAV